MANQDGGFISQLVSHALGLNLFGGSSEVVNNGEDASIDNTLSRETRQADRNDLYAAASGGYGGYCPEGIPVEFALLSLLAAFGVAFGILYRALTLITGRRRRKRSADPGSHDLTSADYVEEKTGDAVIDTVSDLLWWDCACIDVATLVKSFPKLDVI